MTDLPIPADQALLDAADIGKAVTPRHARHIWASWHYAAHRDTLLLKHVGGWSSVDQVERFTHLTPDGLAPAVFAFLGMPLHLDKQAWLAAA